MTRVARPHEESHGIAPVFLHAGLACESYDLRQFVCRQRPGILEKMIEANRPRPETSTLAFCVFDQENQAMRTLISVVEDFGWTLACPVFDGIVAMPGPDSLPGTQDAIVREFTKRTNLHVSNTCISDRHST